MALTFEIMKCETLINTVCYAVLDDSNSFSSVDEMCSFILSTFPVLGNFKFIFSRILPSIIWDCS